MKPRSLNRWTPVEAAHLLNRAGFSGSPREIRALHKMGPEKAVDQLVDGPEGKDPLPPPDWADAETYREKAREYAALRRETRMTDRMMQMDGAGEMSAQDALKKRQELQRMIRRNSFRQGAELVQWWMRRMIRGTHPLEEKMVLFWHGHFATSMEKVRETWFMYQQNALLRAHALGDFATLTKAVVRDPAMMLYLDIHQSRKEKPNENFAREIMELFTVGEGHYTEADIRESARAFTGLWLNRLTGETGFALRRHDGGEKTFLGRMGKFGPDDIVDILVEEEACSRFLARKLWRFFVNDAPAEKDVESFAAVLREEQMILGPALRRLFLSEAFYRESNIRALIKSPVVYLVQLARQLELDDLPLLVAGGAMRDMGQVLFRPPNVAGWPGGAAWITTNTLFARYNYAGVLTRSNDPDYSIRKLGKGGGPIAQGLSKRMRERLRQKWPKPDYQSIVPEDIRTSPDQVVDALVRRLYQFPIRAEDQASFLEFARKEARGGLTDIEVGHLVHLMMSSPYYQLT